MMSPTSLHLAIKRMDKSIKVDRDLYHHFETKPFVVMDVFHIK